jgi:hypothetical protein
MEPNSLLFTGLFYKETFFSILLEQFLNVVFVSFSLAKIQKTIAAPLSLFAYLNINWNGKQAFALEALIFLNKTGKSKVVKFHLISLYMLTS